jgi:hypothetical protein
MGSLVPVLLTCCVTTSRAQGGQSVDEQLVRSMEERERLAVLDKDEPALRQIWAEEFIVNNPMNFVTLTRDQVIAFVLHGHIDYSKFERTIEHVRITGDVAVVMGSETVVPKPGTGRPAIPVHRRFTDVWRKQGTTWREIARHANVVCDEPP